ncbi:MAG: hypothetical protein FWD33_02365 [Alphaproteobacteria bacterium]|nr:hypothetical protein [Alphaproteobacteria bacterium]
MTINSALSGGCLRGKKTYITAVTGVISAIGMYLAGDADLFLTLHTIFPMLGMLFLRTSIKERKHDERNCDTGKIQNCDGRSEPRSDT